MLLAAARAGPAPELPSKDLGLTESMRCENSVVTANVLLRTRVVIVFII